MRFKDARNMGIAHIVRRGHREERLARLSAMGIRGFRSELAFLREKQRPAVQLRREMEAAARRAADERIAAERAAEAFEKQEAEKQRLAAERLAGQAEAERVIQSRWMAAREMPDAASRGKAYRALRVPDDMVMARRRLSNDACFWCGGPYDGDIPALRRSREHVIPRSHGGDSAYSNVVFSHISCNNRRGSDISWIPFHIHGEVGQIVKRTIRNDGSSRAD